MDFVSALHINQLLSAPTVSDKQTYTNIPSKLAMIVFVNTGIEQLSNACKLDVVSSKLT